MAPKPQQHASTPSRAEMEQWIAEGGSVNLPDGSNIDNLMQLERAYPSADPDFQVQGFSDAKVIASGPNPVETLRFGPDTPFEVTVEPEPESTPPAAPKPASAKKP